MHAWGAVDLRIYLAKKKSWILNISPDLWFLSSPDKTWYPWFHTVSYGYAYLKKSLVIAFFLRYCLQKYFSFKFWFILNMWVLFLIALSPIDPQCNLIKSEKFRIECPKMVKKRTLFNLFFQIFSKTMIFIGWLIIIWRVFMFWVQCNKPWLFSM